MAILGALAAVTAFFLLRASVDVASRNLVRGQREGSLFTLTGSSKNVGYALFANITTFALSFAFVHSLVIPFVRRETGFYPPETAAGVPIEYSLTYAFDFIGSAVVPAIILFVFGKSGKLF